MPRTDYFNDPHAPAPNSLVPATSAIVVNETGALLLQRRLDNHQWALPGGTMDLGETLAQTAVREVKEETGLDVEVTGLVGEVRQEFNICLTARLTGGQLATSTESKEVAWVSPGNLDALPMHESTRIRIRRYLGDRAQPYIG